MRTRLWDELMQCKHNHYYSLYVLERKKNVVKWFTIVTLAFSGAGGIMGWKIWTNFPLFACIIIALMQLFKLLQPQLIPSDKEIDKLNKVINFYFDYYNKLEQLWYDHYNKRIDDEQAQKKFYIIKATEKEINEIVNEVVKKRVSKRLYERAEIETNSYVNRTFNN
jgi:hypothetical protein